MAFGEWTPSSERAGGAKTWATGAGLTLLASAALAGPVPDYDWEWATIGDPGNAAYIKQTGPDAGEAVGAVNYRYRIARTEVTASQWSEFATGYAPFLPDLLTYQTQFHGRFNRRRTNPDGSVYYVPIGGTENVGEELGWEFALAFCNWLHNGKVNEQWAFETGAYDLTHTWWNDPDGGTAVPERSAGARFWLPTEDEWIKAMHYDPNRYGAGEGGYWMYPDSSDTPLIPGYPEDGGETDAGLDMGDPIAHYVPVGSYVDVMSSWGLFDGSGGSRELVNEYDPEREWLTVLGSGRFDPYPEFADDIDSSVVAPPSGLFGFRIASTVPPPSAAPTLGAGVWFLFGRRSRRFP